MCVVCAVFLKVLKPFICGAFEYIEIVKVYFLSSLLNFKTAFVFIGSGMQKNFQVNCNFRQFHSTCLSTCILHPCNIIVFQSLHVVKQIFDSKLQLIPHKDLSKTISCVANKNFYKHTKAINGLIIIRSKSPTALIRLFGQSKIHLIISNKKVANLIENPYNTLLSCSFARLWLCVLCIVKNHFKNYFWAKSYFKNV